MTQETDRELLEYAAKAAGLDQEIETWFFIEIGDLWNPLENNSDALELAIKIRISILLAETQQNTPECVFCKHSNVGPIWDATISFDHDPYAATRRAIVRAAAEIGKAM